MPWLKSFVAVQPVWDFRWMTSHLDGYSNGYFGLTMSVSIHQPSVFTDSFIYDRRVNYFKKHTYLASMIENNARYKCEIKSQTTMEKISIQQEGDSFHYQIGFKFKKETNEMQYLEHSSLWYWKWDTSVHRSEIYWVLKCGAGE